MTNRDGERPMLHNLFFRGRQAIMSLFDRDNEEGQGMVEYALILVLVAVVVIVVLSTVGKQVHNVFSNISSGLGT